MYRHDMSGESQRPPVLPEGWRIFKILACVAEVSKQGNEMFKFRFWDVGTAQEAGDIYAVAIKGKRWFLKQILTACDVEAGEDGVYEWDIPDVLGRFVKGNVVHEQEEWINRGGETVKTTKSKIREIDSLTAEELEETSKLIIPESTPF